MKGFGKGSHEQILGVMIDGRELKIAHLGRQGGEIVIHALESVTLQHRLGKIHMAKAVTPTASENAGQDIFGLEETAGYARDFPEPEVEEGDVSTALVNTFSKYLLKRVPIAINVPEGQTTYYSFESDFGLKGKNLIKRLREEISPLAGGSLDMAVLDYFKSETGALTVVVSEGSIPLVEELIELKNFLPTQPLFSLVGSNEIALVNLVRMNLDLRSDEITAVVYIGCEFSRVIMMRGENPISFLQTIREGYQTPQICQTLFSKILLEQEEAGLVEINQIALTGEIGVPRAFEFFSKQFPEAKVQLLTPGPLNTQLLQAEQIAIFPNYAVPVALAWEALEKKDPRFIRADLVPASIKEQQKLFKVTWHGFVLLGLIFVFMLLLSYQGLSRWNSIKSLEESVRRKQETIESLQPDMALIGQLQSQMGNYRSNLGFLDSLIVDPGKWSRLLNKLAQDFQSVNRIWIEAISSEPAGFHMVGKALARDRIPRLAECLPEVDLKRVTRVINEEGVVTYEYEMTAGIPAPDTCRTPSLFQPGNDHVNTPGGSIPGATAESPKQNTVQPEPTVEAQEKPADPSAPLTDHAPPESGAAGLYQSGLAMVREGNVQKALEAFAALVAEFPQAKETPAAKYWIGECHYAQGDFTTAAADFQASLGYPINRKREAATLMLGLTYLKLGQDDQARIQFEALLQEFPDGEFSQKARSLLQQMSTEG